LAEQIERYKFGLYGKIQANAHSHVTYSGFLAIENPKRLQSLNKKLIFNLKKLFKDGFHGKTCQMLKMNIELFKM